VLVKLEIPKIIEVSKAEGDLSREPTMTSGMNVEFEAESKPFD